MADNIVKFKGNTLLADHFKDVKETIDPAPSAAMTVILHEDAVEYGFASWVHSELTAQQIRNMIVALEFAKDELKDYFKDDGSDYE